MSSFAPEGLPTLMGKPEPESPASVEARKNCPYKSRRLSRFIPSLLALVLIGGLFALSQQPQLPDQESAALASRFRFTKVSLPELPGYPNKTVREVHPSLRHLAGQVSFVGAAVALADLDCDGLPNDLINVDPRTDQVLVTPAPGTGDRYAPFTLHPSSQLPFRPSTMAPMGCLVGDFNEDGRPDILVYYWGRSPILFLQVASSATESSGVLIRERFVPRELIEPYQVWYTSAATQADLDGDGHTDLIIGNYYRDGSHILDAEAAGREQWRILDRALLTADAVAYFFGRERAMS